MQSLSIATRYLDGGRERFVELVQASALEGHDDAIKWWLVYADLLPSERIRVSFDDVTAAAGIKPSRLVGIITSTAMEMGRDVGNLVAALTHPQVVAAGVAAAKHPDGIEDRKLLFQHHGFIPIPRAATPVITINASASAQAAAGSSTTVELPGFGEDLAEIGRREVVDALPSGPASQPAGQPIGQSALPEADFDQNRANFTENSSENGEFVEISVVPPTSDDLADVDVD